MKKDLQSQHNLIQAEFKKQASGWGKRQDNLSSTLSVLELQEDYTVLDVASGSGLLASIIAPHVKQVVAMDITPEMLQQARMKGIENIQYVLGAAEQLPHAENTFERVATRYSIHHILEPQVVIEEIYRTCQSNGRVMIIDIIAPDDEESAELYNHMERLRDPSHTNALSLSTLTELIANAGFKQITHSMNNHGEMDLENWFDLAQTPDENRQQVLSLIDDALQGKIETGFNPTYRDGRLKINHSVATILATK